MKKVLLFFAALSSMLLVHAEKEAEKPHEESELFFADSTQFHTLEQVTVVASPKDHLAPRQQPVAVSLFPTEELEENRIFSLKNLTNLVPSLYIPEYGSRLTSAVYIRGVGSRVNTPSVGLYVDDVPVLDKSGYDFYYDDVKSMEVLRGPQGTLYGRNTMGGLIKIYTRSPWNHKGTDVRLSTGSQAQNSGSVMHYNRLGDTFAYSVGGFYARERGFLKNEYLDKRADRGSTTGGRMRAIYKPSEGLKMDLNVSYQYSDQLGYAYAPYDPDRKETGSVSYNDESSYYRNLFSASLNAEYQATHFILNAITGYQFLKDRMFMDQDYTAQDIFTLEQKQRMNAFSEEITLKNRTPQRWNWLWGAFGFYQSLKTQAPVTFKEEGISQQLENTINEVLPPSLGASIRFEERNLLIGSDFDSPSYGFAAFHQSTWNDLGVKGLSFTAGLRLDYEKNKLEYHSASSFGYEFPLVAMGSRYELGNSLHSAEKGSLDQDYVQLLPKFALSYSLNPRNLIYASVSKGYRSGGYNIQMLSDLARSGMQVDLTDQIRENLRETMTNAGAPEQVVNMVSNYIPTFTRMDAEESLTYKPEFCWNYEIGAHLTLWENRLWADASLFYIDLRDQQIARFVDSGLGRMVVNAGRSQSRGAEVSLRAKMYRGWSATAGYGYTYATFRRHLVREATETEEALDYSGKYVPFIPKHTLNMSLRYDLNLSPYGWLDGAWASVNYQGAGRIYWTEKNEVSQRYYNLWGYNVGISKGNAELMIWTRNLGDTKYNTFCFTNSTSQDQYFAQKGRPLQAGIDLRFHF